MSLKSRNNLSKISGVIKESYLSGYSEEFVGNYINFFTSMWPDKIEAIIFYGSCLSETTKGKSSTPDFFIICNNYFSFHHRFVHAILNMTLAPSLYSICYNRLRGKYNVLSFKNLKRETSERAKDIYILGRLTKKTAIIFTKDESSQSQIIDYISNAYYTVALKALYLIKGKFSIDQFIENAISISYIGEKRIEADNKISKLKASQESFYKRIYSLILEDFISGGIIKKDVKGYMLANPGSSANRFRRLCLKYFLFKSRVRAKLRWPKSIFTFKGWVDVLLSKIERTKGIKINLSEKERKYPLIYGWKYYFKLKRDKMIK